MGRDQLGLSRRVALRALLLCALLCLLGTFSALSYATAAVSPFGGATRYGKIQHVCPLPAPGEATCFALVRTQVPAADASHLGVHAFKLHDGAAQAGPAGGLTPAQLASSYGYDPAASATGQTVAIVDAYDDPNIEGDLAEFERHYGISSCGECFTKLSQAGSRSQLPAVDTRGWSVEITLDVETVRAACHNCKILLVEANSSSLLNLGDAVNEAVALKATEVSNSYGGPEQSISSTELADYDHPGVVIAAATGDYGYDDWTELYEEVQPPAAPNLPAALASVVSVGGTSLQLNGAGKRANETVWNGNGPLSDSELVEGASGGGCSLRIAAPLWQQSTAGFAASGCGDGRLSADVAAVADPLTGFDIYDTYDCGPSCEGFRQGRSWLTIGGTSLATPLISALYALAGGSGGVSYPALTLYGHLGDPAAVYDVTEGGNGYCDEGGRPCGVDAESGLALDCEGTTACNAAPGYDGPSGVGAPSSLKLFEPQTPVAVISAPPTADTGVAAPFSAAGSSDSFPGATIAGYSWSWGDGTAGSGGAPTHTYSSPGEYLVTLTVADSFGQTALASAPVTVTGASTQTGGGSSTGAGQSAGTGSGPTSSGSRGGSAGSSSGDGSQGVEGFHQRSAPVPDARLALALLRVGASGAFTLRVSCPEGESRCTGTVTLRTLASKGLTLASATFAVSGGKISKLTLHLSKRGRALLASLHSLHARATLAAHDQAGAHHTTLTLVTLRAAGPR